MKSIFLSPHDDDSVLFGAFTCLREKPIVVIVTDAYIQSNRGEVGCDAETRANESKEAHKILGCKVLRMGIPDHLLTEISMAKEIGSIVADKIYIPALQGGNLHHDIVHRVAKSMWPDKVIEYTTYTRTELWTKGDTEVIPTPEELDLKSQALGCYTSQINLPATRPHFEAVKGKSEWLNK